MHAMSYCPPTCFPTKHDSRLYNIAKINKELAGKSSTIHDLCPDIWAQIFEYFEIMDLFATFGSITDAVDQVLFNENNRFLLRGLILDASVKYVPESIP
ncbi:unnamed protein product, partial [Rotaria magnacalcarata]